MAPDKPRDGFFVPQVKWGPFNVIVASTITVLVSIAILSLGGVLGTDTGFDTSVTSPTGYYIGFLSGAGAVILLQLTRSPLWPIILALLSGIAIIWISYLVAVDVGNGAAEVMGVPLAVITATVLSGTFAVTALSFSAVLYRQPVNTLGFVKIYGLKPYVFAVGMWLIALIILMFWIGALNWLKVDFLLPPDTAQQVMDKAGGNLIATLILVGIVGPIAEEIFFRGFVLPGLMKRFGVTQSLLFSSLLFGIFHFDPGAIVPTFILGLALGWVYLKTGALWPAIFAHGLHNSLAIMLAKYAPEI
jgi:membrane protease YdiL (CAAX protease family)